MMFTGSLLGRPRYKIVSQGSFCKCLESLNGGRVRVSCREDCLE